MQFQSLGQEDPLEEGMGIPLQYACLENPMDRGAWWAAVHGVTKSWAQLSDLHTWSIYIPMYIILNKSVSYVYK